MNSAGRRYAAHQRRRGRHLVNADSEKQLKSLKRIKSQNEIFAVPWQTHIRLSGSCPLPNPLTLNGIQFSLFGVNSVHGCFAGNEKRWELVSISVYLRIHYSRRHLNSLSNLEIDIPPMKLELRYDDLENSYLLKIWWSGK